MHSKCIENKFVNLLPDSPQVPITGWIGLAGVILKLFFVCKLLFGWLKSGGSNIGFLSISIIQTLEEFPSGFSVL